MSGLTEREVLDRLERRYSRPARMGERRYVRWVGARHVRLEPFTPASIADFLVQDTFGNYGPLERRHPLLGFEVKVSRSDWLTELKNPGKSEPFRRVCSEWYLVVSDRAIVRDDLPAGWGLMVVAGEQVRCVVKPIPNLDPEPMSRGLAAAFLRAVATQHGRALGNSDDQHDGSGR